MRDVGRGGLQSLAQLAEGDCVQKMAVRGVQQERASCPAPPNCNRGGIGCQQGLAPEELACRSQPNRSWSPCTKDKFQKHSALADLMHETGCHNAN